MNTNQWSFSWKPSRMTAALPDEAEMAVRSFMLDEFYVRKPFSYRGKEFEVELRPGGTQGAGFFIIATRVSDGVEFPITPHFVSLPTNLVCKITYKPKRAYKKKSKATDASQTTEDTSGDMEVDSD